MYHPASKNSQICTSCRKLSYVCLQDRLSCKQQLLPRTCRVQAGDAFHLPLRIEAHVDIQLAPQGVAEVGA